MVRRRPGTSSRRLRLLLGAAFLALAPREVSAWSSAGHARLDRRAPQLAAGIDPPRPGDDPVAPLPRSPPLPPLSRTAELRSAAESANAAIASRRRVVARAFALPLLLSLFLPWRSPPPAKAYTPDPNPLRESLYLVSRVQEATVQQERFVRRASDQSALRNKMKLTLRLVEKNYRLLDQITFASEYVSPSSKVVEATEAGYEAAEALQAAIDYVDGDLKAGEFEEGQKEYLSSNLAECRERLFDFLAYMPKEELEAARKRVEEENVANRDEFDGNSDAGVYNPVVLPWKNR
ncbi:hypothetical protein ACHAWF_001655 [Thalassiosira exigua]